MVGMNRMDADLAGEGASETAELRTATSRSPGQIRPALSLQRTRTLRDLKVDCYIPPEALECVGKLGQGAFASVEKSWYTSPDGTRSLVAVKRLKPEVLTNTEDFSMFVQETHLMRLLTHRHIVHLVGVGELSGGSTCNVYMVQECLAGGTLKQLVTAQMLLDARRCYSDADAADICLQIAEALAYLHNHDPLIIHRDLKLENVLLTSAKKVNGQYLVKLADFGLSAKVERNLQQLRSRKDLRQLLEQPTGLSRRASTEQEEKWDSRMADFGVQRVKSRAPSQELVSALSTRFDLTGQTGSLMYMAPEVFCGKPYNEKADVFSFGMILYEVMQRYVTSFVVSVSGSPDEFHQYAARVAAGYRPHLNARLPEQVQQLIKACWAGNPSERPHMSDVVIQLQQILAAAQANASQQPRHCAQCTVS